MTIDGVQGPAGRRAVQDAETTMANTLSKRFALPIDARQPVPPDAPELTRRPRAVPRPLPRAPTAGSPREFSSLVILAALQRLFKPDR